MNFSKTLPPVKPRLPLALLPLAAGLLLIVEANGATLLYSEDFDIGASNTSVNTLGWTAGDNGGNPLSTTTSGEMYVQTIDAARIGSGVAGQQYAMVSDAGSIDPAGYSSGLTISMSQRYLTAAGGSWRVLVQIGSEVYASTEVAAPSGSYTTIDVSTADSVWSLWSSESSLSGLVGSSFSVGGISGTAGNLPSGTISNFGVLALDAVTGSGELVITQFDIYGVPEPGSATLLGLACLAMLRRRRI